MVRLLKALAAAALTVGAGLATTNAIAAPDAAAGGKLAIRCTVCHSLNKGGPNIVGPNLYGVVGRQAGSLPGYSYSPAMKRAGVTWSQDTLSKFLMGPAAYVHGTKMTFGGFPQQDQAASVAAYLATLK